MIKVNRPEKFRLIMISAMYENGGNTTHRTLDGHPNLLVYPFESQVGTAAGSNLMDAWVPLRYRWPEFPSNTSPEEAYEMFWDEELKTFLRAPQRSKFKDCGVEMEEAARKQWFYNFLDRKPRTRADFVEAFFRSTFAAWRNHNGSGKETHFVGYNPVQVFDTPKILEDWPEAQVLHVMRNPFSGFADTSKRPFPLPLQKYSWIWNICQLQARTYAEKYKGRFHILRFEDLVQDRRGSMGNLLEAMALPWSDEVMYPSFNSRRLEQVFPWGTIKTPTSEANLKTANELSSDQKKHIQAECAVMLDLCGYGSYYRDYLT